MVTRAEPDANASLRLTLRFNQSQSAFTSAVPVSTNSTDTLQTLAVRPPPHVLEQLSGVSVQLVGAWTSLAVNVVGPYVSCARFEPAAELPSVSVFWACWPFVTEARQLPVAPPPPPSLCALAEQIELEVEAAFMSNFLHYSETLGAHECCDACARNQPGCALSFYETFTTKFSPDQLNGERQCFFWNISGPQIWNRGDTAIARESDVMALLAIFSNKTVKASIASNRPEACGAAGVCECSNSFVDCSDRNLHSPPR
eukprot:2013851-Prymnesium_polylepis.1